MAHRFFSPWLLAGLLAAAGAAPAQVPPAQLAADHGCYNCHGTPPLRNVPPLKEIAARYAKYRNQPGAAARLAADLRKGSLFSHIAAHERLSPQDCERLMQWLIDGAP